MVSQASGRAERGAETILTVSGVGVKVGGHVILEDISFSVRKATTLAIVGPNGGGKTTLFRALLGLVPCTGTIRWGGSVKIGLVPQHFYASDIPLTVREFLEFKKRERLEDGLAMVGLPPETLSKRLSSLSGGEMQRVLIAWAVLDLPDVLLFDEPTANVDIGSEELIYQMLNMLEKQNGITVLLISHDVHVVLNYSDSVLALNKQVLFFGGSKELENSDVIHRVFGYVLSSHEH